MIKGAKYWRDRATVAEAEAATLKLSLEAAQEQLDGIQARIADRAALVSITARGRSNRFLFVRNGQMITVETYSTLSDDVQGWRDQLLGEQ